MKKAVRFILAVFFALPGLPGLSQRPDVRLAFTVSMEQPRSHTYRVTLRCEGLKEETVDFRMPAWTPGYYQLMNYAAQVANFSAVDGAGKPVRWEKSGNSTWRVQTGAVPAIVLTYEIKAVRNFVAANFLDENKGYISPAGLFLYPVGYLRNPVTVSLQPYPQWNGPIATGLDSVAGKPRTYFAADYDALYDSPILMGNLEKLPVFLVKGIPHYFIGYQLGDFDRKQFIADLQKIVESAAALIGDIPYRHYTFLAIGPGGGGIEHLNSASISFNGSDLNSREGKLRLYHFLAHEYFHHYNVKRIRPVELGPFDYDAENRTRLLWVAEGFTVYYEYLILKRAGLATEEDVLTGLQRTIASYENKPGRLFQPVTRASYETWEDGPFGRSGDEAYKTISYYAKGPALGALLDLKIRHETGNKKSLDDVMRALYREYYQKQKRGFTEAEFRAECEKIAGAPLSELFEYASTTKEIDYPKYVGYAGLAVDTTLRDVPGGWLGVSARERADSLIVSEVEWESPAWKAGLRSRAAILEIDGKKAGLQQLLAVGKEKNAGDSIQLLIWQNGQKRRMAFALGKKRERSFRISRRPDPNPLQAAILKDWLRNP